MRFLLEIAMVMRAAHTGACDKSQPVDAKRRVGALYCLPGSARARGSKGRCLGNPRADVGVDIVEPPVNARLGQ
jgi:hypothetical protein